MTNKKQGFLEHQVEISSSEKILKSVLKEREIPYSTYNYWRNKILLEEGLLPMAPIAIKGSVPSVISNAYDEFNRGSDVEGIIHLHFSDVLKREES